MPRKRKTSNRAPRSTSFVSERYTLANGTADAIGNVTMLTYSIGNCPSATVENPHNRGTKPDTCDSCYLVS